MYLDVLIDPLALKGDKWFLGQIYAYAGKGVYFGVPISNFVGWFVVGFLLIYALQLIDRLLAASKAKDLPGIAYAWRHLPGPALYVSIIIFNLSVALLIREDSLLWSDILILLLPSVLFVSLMRTRRYGVAP
jgi:putative membrane protein